MKPVKQTRVIRDGNCLQACVASLFGLPLDFVPHFCRDKKNWLKSLEDWCKMKGYEVSCIYISSSKPLKEQFEEDKYYIVYGRSPTITGGYHCVIYKGNRRFFDPNPNNRFIKGSPIFYFNFKKL